MKRPMRPTAGEAGRGYPSAHPAGTASEISDEAWIDPFHDEMPERDVRADLLTDEDAAPLPDGKDGPAPAGEALDADRLHGAGDGPARPGEPLDAALQATQDDAGPATFAADEPRDGGFPNSEHQNREPQGGEVLDSEVLDSEALDREVLDRQPQPAVRDTPPAEDEPADAPPARRGRPRGRPRSVGAKPRTTGAILAPPADQEQPSPPASPPALPVEAVARSRRGAPRRLPPGQRWKERRLPRVCWDR